MKKKMLLEFLDKLETQAVFAGSRMLECKANNDIDRANFFDGAYRALEIVIIKLEDFLNPSLDKNN
jgi:hypothetical protein